MMPMDDPLNEPIGAFAHGIMTALEPIIGDHSVVLLIVAPDGAAMAIESGGFDDPSHVLVAMRAALTFMGEHAPTDVTRHEEA